MKVLQMNNHKNYKIVFLGIDGAGKTTISNEIKIWLEKKGKTIKIIPFHKWVFADRLKRKFSKVIEKNRPNIKVPYEPKKKSLAAYIKPPIAFLDNLLFYWQTLHNEKTTDVIIFDRFICATQIKFLGLNYHANWFKFLWWNINPDLYIIFDISPEVSVKRQKERNDPYSYKIHQLKIERKLYKKLAKKKNAIFIHNQNKDETILKIKEIINKRYQL